jgi:hypothetical protein
MDPNVVAKMLAIAFLVLAFVWPTVAQQAERPPTPASIHVVSERAANAADIVPSSTVMSKGAIVTFEAGDKIYTAWESPWLTSLEVVKDYPVAKWKGGEIYLTLIFEKGRAKGESFQVVLSIQSIAEKPTAKDREK